MNRATIHRLAPRHPSRLGAVLSIALLALVLTSGAASAQPAFTEFALTDTALNSSASTDFWIASAAPADVDADGDLDLVIAGYFVVYATEEQDGSVEERLTLYRNDGPGAPGAWVLTPLALDATGLAFGSGDLAFGDYDGDGDPDLVVGASDGMALYRNDAGTLVRTSTALPLYWEDSDFTTMDLRSITWADADNDGDPDLLVPSIEEDFSYLPTRLLRNDGPGAGDAWTFTDAGAALPVAPNGASAWADMEGDGDLDLLLGHISPYGDSFLDTFRNDAGTFVRADTGLAHIRYGSADWGDPDGDGDLDVVYAGNIDLPDGTGESVVRILFKQGDGSYLPVDVANADFSNPNEPWLDFGAVTWADYDSDGDVDLLVSGEWLGSGEIFGRAVVYVNTAGTFAAAGEPLPAPIAGNAGGAFTWMDLDGDGDLDYFVAGAYYVEDGNGLVEARTQLFRNDAPGANAPPSAPAAAQATVAGDDVTLSWSPASDDDTPPSALTYGLEIVEAGAAAATGRALPEPGNVSRNTSWTVRGLPAGDYAWRVRALDNAFEDGPVAAGVFSIGSSVSAGTPAPIALQLSGPAPNPSSDGALLSLAVDRAQLVRVAVFDLAGRTVAVLHDGWLPSGRHEVRWDGLRDDGTRASAGVYVVRAAAGMASSTRRLTLLH